MFELRDEIARKIKEKKPAFDASSFLDYMLHEQKVYKYVTKSQEDRVIVGTTEFQITQDSFKLIELDLEQLSKPCKVCAGGVTCYLRTFCGIAEVIDLNLK